MAPEGRTVIDPLSKIGRELQAAEDFFALAKNSGSPFMQAYYRRVAERYLSSKGELKPVKGQNDEAGAIRTQPPVTPQQAPRCPPDDKSILRR
jgi:hypothetical protein